MEMILTNGKDKDFLLLCNELDNYLNKMIGSEKQKNQYDKHNNVENINDVVIVIDNNTAIGCGSFKEYNANIAELKRIFICEKYRRKGLAIKIINRLESIAKSKGYHKLILETGISLKSAQKLYSRLGYNIRANYGPYTNMKDSICMEKSL